MIAGRAADAANTARIDMEIRNVKPVSLRKACRFCIFVTGKGQIETAVGKSILADRLDVFIQCDTVQPGAVIECAVVNVSQRLRQNDLCQFDAPIEGVSLDLRKILRGEYDRFHAFASVERAHAQRGE